MKEASVGKITRKFVVKLVIWFVLLYIVLGVAVISSFASEVENINDEVLIGESLNGFMIKFIVGNVVAIILSVLLATRKIKKKFVINSDNNKQIVKNIMITLIVMTILVIGIHAAIKAAVIDFAAEAADIDDVDEFIDDTEAYAEKIGLDTSEIKIWEQFTSFIDKTKIFMFDSIAFLVMIPVTKSMIVKNENQGENA